ncbi:MAG: VWA domain-containing protein [Lentisphaeria bacterium]|nr:VWA domain-containing protein [Lentisphaeria bacterium]
MLLLHSDSLWNLFWIVPLFLILILLAASRSKRTRDALFSSARAASSFLNVDPPFRVLRFASLFLAVLFAVLAAAGPAWGRRILPDAGPGRDLMVLFDVSRSMLSDDVKPDRLTQGKWLVRELVRTNPVDRFGLIAFAGNAFLLCPLTIDKTSFLQLADSLDTDTIPLGGTNLQVALEEAVRAFEGAQGSHKAVVVVTDGDELTGSASEVLKKLADAGIPLFIAGVGDPANPSVIPIRNEDGSSSILKDSEGNTVRSPLNEPLLASLAEKTHGMYIRSTAADPGVEEINRAIARLDRRKADGTGLSLTRPIERPGTPFAVSLFFLLLYLSLSEVRRKKDADRTPRSHSAKSVLPLLLFGAALVSAPLRAASPDPAADPGAAAVPEQPALSGEKTEEGSSGEGEKTPVYWFNTGVRAQQDQEPEKAAAAYEKAVASGGDSEVRAGSFQNLGILKHLDARKSFAAANASLKGQNLSEAEKSVGESLARLTDAESLYRESFRYAALNGNTGAIARNQQILLRERKAAEELKKQIEELKKLQEEARKQAEKALQDQQKQNQQQNQDQQPQDQQGQNQQDQQKQDQQQDQQKQDQQQDQQKQDRQDQPQDQQKQDRQDQQKQDQQKQDQNQQENQQKQDQNQQQNQQQQDQQGQNQQDQQKQDSDAAEKQSAQNAAEAAGKLEKKAEEMSQNQLKDQAEKAGEEIRQAMDRQSAGDGRKAEEHLKNAVRMLGGKDGGKDSEKQKEPGSDQQKENPKDENNQDQGKDKESPEKQSGEDRQEKLPKPPAPVPAGAGDSEKKPDRAIDPAQADAILNAMEQDEKELRDMIKEMQKRAMPQREPKKNW